MASTFATTVGHVVSADDQPPVMPAPLPGCLPTGIGKVRSGVDNPAANSRSPSSGAPETGIDSAMVTSSRVSEWWSLETKTASVEQVDIRHGDKIMIEDFSDP
jgi:hypothetical protein